MKIYQKNNRFIRFFFLLLLFRPLNALQNRQTRKPGAAEATSLLYPISNFNYVVAIVIVQMCLAFMKGLSRSLQEISIDVDRALKSGTLVQSSLEDSRANVEQFNQQCFGRSVQICEPPDIKVKNMRENTMAKRTHNDLQNIHIKLNIE